MSTLYKKILPPLPFILLTGFYLSILDTVFQDPAYRIAGDRLDRWNLRLVILADLTKDTSGIISYALGLSPHPIPISLPNER